MIANLFVSTFLSLKAHKLRVFLTMVGIIIGITSVVTISALGEGMKRQVVKASSAVNADVLKIHYTMSDGSNDNFMSYEEPDYTFSRVDLKKLQDIQGIESIYPQYGESMMGGGDNLFVPMDYFGAQANLSITSTKGQNDILYGRDFQLSDANTDAIVLNHDIFEAQIRLDDPSQLIGKAVSIGGYMYKVIGILAPKDLDSLGMNDDWATAMSSFVSRESYNKLAKTKAISGINIKVREGADREAILG
nr:ABC transporter permease [Enterococcus faecalis]